MEKIAFSWEEIKKMIWFFELVEKVKSKFFRKKSISEQNLLLLIVFLMLIISLLPLLVAGFYNHMSGDDWYNVKITHEQVISGNFSVVGLVADMGKDLVDLYSRWSFNYTSFFFYYLMPTGFSENNGWMNTAILLSITVVCMYAVFSKVLRKLLGVEKTNGRIVAALLILVMIQYVPSAFDAFYWWSGAMNSVLGFLLFLLEFEFLISLYNDSEVIKPYKWVMLGIGLFLIAGTSWSAVLVLFVCMLLVLVDMWSRKANNYKYRIPYSIIFIFYTVCILFAVSAPGNAVRATVIESELVENTWIGHPINSILRAYIEGLYLLWKSINPAIILVIGLICLLLLPKLMEKRLVFKCPFIMLFTTYSIYVAAFVPVLYTKGGVGETRINNIQYWYAVLFLAWNACYFLGWYLQKEKIQKEWKVLHEHKLEVIILGLIICCFIMLTGEREPAAKIAMRNYLKGELQQFDREVDARELLLRESPEDGDLWVTRLNCVIPAIFEGYTDLQPDEARFWVNNTVREYYHLKALHVE